MEKASSICKEIIYDIVDKIDDEVSEKEIDRLKQEIDRLNQENDEIIKGFENISKHGDKKLFRDIVKCDTGHEVIKATSEQLEEAKMNAILARDYQIDININIFKDKSGKPRKRFNECGNDMEKVLKDSTNGKLTGLGKSSGYPDLENLELVYYLECKVADKDSMKSAFRSFYLSTLDKVTKSNTHILVCFLHREGKLYKEDKPIVKDLYDLELTMKSEWNASNKDMY